MNIHYYKWGMMVLILISYSVSAVYYHEKAHEQIALFHGCQNYTIDWGINSLGHCALYQDNIPEEYYLQQASKQSDIETLFYHLAPLSIILLSVMMIRWLIP
jgi:hypothetical protein